MPWGGAGVLGSAVRLPPLLLLGLLLVLLVLLLLVLVVLVQVQ